jgi:hypothetical protein
MAQKRMDLIHVFFGPEVLIAAKRVDQPRSTVFCGRYVLCHLVRLHPWSPYQLGPGLL